MKFSDIKGISEAFLAGASEIEKAQTAKTVFQIISRSFYNVLVDLVNYFFILNPKSVQEFCGSRQIPSLIMNTGIEQRIDTEIDAPVGSVVATDYKDKSITVFCGNKKLLKMSGVNLYGTYRRFLTKGYIKRFVSIGDMLNEETIK